MFRCERTQFFEVTLSEGLGLGGQFAQEGEHLRRRFRHFGDQRDLGEIGVTEHAGLFGTQCQYPAHDRTIVQRRLTELGCPGRIGPVQRCA